MSQAHPPEIKLVVIQPSPFCNIDCRYCYLPDRNSRAVIEERTLAKIYERLFASAYLGRSLSLLWHAGEPLAVGIAFYERALELLAQFNVERVRVHQVFQTNCTLVNQAWCDFFAAHECHVGISIDGPQELHDAQRVTRRGGGTFERAMRGVRLLQENRIPIYNIGVLTSAALDRADEIWDFFVAAGITRLAFNIEEQKGVHGESSVNDRRHAERYQAFFRRLQELRKSSGLDIRIRELDDMEERIRNAAGAVESSLNRPLGTVSFDYEGNISTFSPEILSIAHPRYQNFKFGNVFTGGIDGILANERFRLAHDDIQRGIAKCRATCPYFSVCGGGEPTNKLAENGTFDSTETNHCRLVIQSLCDVVLEEIEETQTIAEG